MFNAWFKYWPSGFFCLVLLGAFAGCKKKEPPPPPPPQVQVISLTASNVPIFEEWIGTLDGATNAQIRAQVSGYLMKQDYADGAAVKKGDTLFEIDARPFLAAVAQAKAKLAQDQATLDKATLDVKRYTPLAKDQAISQETLDNAVQAKAAAEAQLKASSAAVESAGLNLEFARITSPIDGLAGIAQAQIGDLVSPSGPILTTVSTIDPMRVYFQVNENSYMKFWRRFISGKDTNDLQMELVLSDGSVFAQKGKFYYADRQVNPNTGTLQVVGLFPNPELTLRPGQYARVRVQTEVKTNAIIVPQRSVMELQGTYQVVTVGGTNKVLPPPSTGKTNETQTSAAPEGKNIAHMQPVTVGEQVGKNWIIEKGLKAGDVIILEGTQKAKEGMPVDPNPPGTPIEEDHSKDSKGKKDSKKSEKSEKQDNAKESSK